jgi:hypothetical protein
MSEEKDNVNDQLAKAVMTTLEHLPKEAQDKFESLFCDKLMKRTQEELTARAADRVKEQFKSLLGDRLSYILTHNLLVDFTKRGDYLQILFKEEYASGTAVNCKISYSLLTGKWNMTSLLDTPYMEHETFDGLVEEVQELKKKNATNSNKLPNL